MPEAAPEPLPEAPLQAASETAPEAAPESGPGNASPPPTAPFSLTPGGPPDVVTAVAGRTGYPGVRMTATGDEPVLPLDAYVALPRGKGLEFHAEGGANCLLTVQDAHGKTTAYPGNPSPDGRSLTFQGVDPALSGKGTASTAWVAVRAGDGARPGSTALAFCLGDAASPSTTVRIVDDIPFSVFPGGPPDVTLDHDHPVGYPGVRVRADDDGTVSPQDVYVALPAGKGLYFSAESGPNYGLTVQDAHGTPHLFPGHAAADGQALLFPGVDLFLSEKGAESTVWVAVTAKPAGEAGSAKPHTPAASKEPAALTFCVGVRTARSTPVVVDARPW
ncbi:hypothetical protein [Streptomyces huiliensis]|uniref:hypothetical protein n=1 Tax=Streptomyces huiliensis TaxID=2876027 RepID=UPI001CBDF134|nr:hypothetical protein [Streptomyces huiliensis]MBZ4323398.1 hypothetical protein [Streptomyces huiliensis]